ncbi:MAG: M23 family metallopeptidase [Calditrichia bacterium]
MIISPVSDKFPVTQGYGERPEFYKKIGIKYGIPLKYHDGIDIGTPLNTPIYSPIDGKVNFKNDPDGYGKYVVMTGLPYNKAGDYRECLMAHLSGFCGIDGEEVRAGDQVGISGNSGNSSGSHLHFSIRRRDKKGKVINYQDNCGWQNIFNKGWIIKNEISKF